MAKERHKYCVITTDDMVLTDIQYSNVALSIHAIGDYSGEEGLWRKKDNDFGRYRHCSRCDSRIKIPQRYCPVCGSRNEIDWESEKENE